MNSYTFNLVKNSYQDIIIILFILSTFFLQIVHGPIIVLMLIGLFFKREERLNVKKRISINNPSIWFVIYFLLHLLGIIYSSNQNLGWLDISMKLSMLLFPLFFLFTSKVSFNRFMDLFSFIGSLSVVVCLFIMAYKMFFLNHNVLKTEDEFSVFLHRSYQSIYWCIGAIWCLFQLLYFERKIMNFCLTLLLSVGTIFTYSKVGILCLLFSICIALFLLVFRLRLYKVAFITSFFIFLSLIGINHVTKKPMARFNVMINSIFTSTPDKSDSNNIRLTVWSSSVDIITENPFFGVGTGDVKQAIKKRSLVLGNKEIAEKNFNAHNQFLNSGVALGIPALLILLGVFVSGFTFILRFHKSRLVVGLILFSIFLFMLTESGFERQAGIVPFTFLICLLGCRSFDSSVIPENQNYESE